MIAKCPCMHVPLRAATRSSLNRIRLALTGESAPARMAQPSATRENKSRGKPPLYGSE